MNGNYPSQKIDCKNGFDSPKYLNGNQAFLKPYNGLYLL